MTSPFHIFRTYDGFSIRYGIWPCRHEQKAGSLVLLGGRREFMEKYDETVSELRQRRFDVYSMDWRGQGLSSRQLPNRHKGYVRCYDDYLDDLDRFFNKVIRPQAVSPTIILAHSMGGHIALRFLHDHSDAVQKAILISPMIDIAGISHIGRSVLRLFCRLAAAAGLAGAYLFGTGDYGAADRKFSGNRLTSDPTRFGDEHRAIAANPDLALGSVSYSWLKASLESIDILEQPAYPENIRTPVLIIGAGMDRVVSLKAQQEICRRLPNCRLRIIAQARHEVLKERAEIRNEFWQEFDRFLESPGDFCATS